MCVVTAVLIYSILKTKLLSNQGTVGERQESDRFHRTQCPVAESAHCNPERHDYNGNCMQSHVDVVHNRLNPDDLQGDSLLRSTM